MKNKWKNSVTVEGYIFNLSLQDRVTGEKSKNPGRPYINGVINVATDDDATNVVPVYFSFVTPTYGVATAERPEPKANPNYTTLQGFIDGKYQSYEQVGTSATKVRIQGDIEVNDFLSSRTGEMVAQKRVRGGFINVIGSLSGRGAHFEVDTLISSTNLREVEGQEPYLQLKGYCFNYKNDILPVEFSTTKGLKYFEDADISAKNPMLVNLRGQIIATTVVQKREIENVFGDPEVDTTTRTFRAWDVTGASEPMEFDDDSTITMEEVRNLISARNVYVAQRRKEQEEYQASRNGGGFAVADVKPASQVPSGMDTTIF